MLPGMVTWNIKLLVNYYAGNVKDIMNKSTRSKNDYQNKFNKICQYMHSMNVPRETQERVKLWCRYTWQTQKTFDESAILAMLPDKMRTDIALNIHYDTLTNVKLFQGCDPGLLKELVVKLRPIVYLSGEKRSFAYESTFQGNMLNFRAGDYICKKGDVGKEMYIIAVGQIQVIGGGGGDNSPSSSILATLGAGVCFGEIALLGLCKRTADIRALGYTTLFVLDKQDLEDALNYVSGFFDYFSSPPIVSVLV